MATHRSLNKLEFKAHMSIHNTADVFDAESHESAYTRDRFGRCHKLFDGDGAPRLFRPRAAAWALALILMPLAGRAWAVPENVRVTSDDLETQPLDERLKVSPREKKPVIYDDGSTSVGFTDDGDPHMAMRF